MAIYTVSNNHNEPAFCAARLPGGGDIISSGTPVKEKATGILFPQLCNGYYLAGCVRVPLVLGSISFVRSFVSSLCMFHPSLTHTR